MITRTFLRWFLTIVLILAFYIGLLTVDLGFSLNMTYNYSVMGENDPISVWRTLVDKLFTQHNTAMAYVYIGIPILLVLLFIIQKKYDSNP